MKTYKIIYVAILLFVLGLTQGNAQQIVKAEYYFSPDPGIGNGIEIPITPGDSINVTFTADLSSLEPGNYSVFVRLMDDNNVWSQTMYRYLVIEPTYNIEPIAKAEYFFNDDPGVGNGIPIDLIPGDSIDVTSTISIENLDPGNHTLCVRTRDSNGNWSTMNSSNVYVESLPKTGQIIAIEYFFDNDPGAGNGYMLSVPNTDTLDMTLDISIPPELEFGEHRLFVRTQSEDSLWSQYISHYFIACDAYGPLSNFDFTLSSDRWVAFEDKSQNSTSWLWDFDDGQTDTAQHPLHQFEFPGVYQVKQYAINSCGTDTIETEVYIRGVYSLESNKAGNSGSAIININGFGFTNDSEVKLVREGFSLIFADTVGFVNDELLRTRFDLQGQTPGFWDVHVTLPSDTTFIVSDAFEILEGGAPDLQVSVLGRYKILVNRDYSYNIAIQNHGYEDAVGIPFIIRDIPESAILRIDDIDTLDFWTNPFYNDITNYVLSNNIDSSVIDFKFKDEQNSMTGYAFVIPYIPANSTLNFTVKLHLTETGGVTPEFIVAPQGYLSSSSLLQNNPFMQPLNCRSGEFISALEMTLDTTFSNTEWEACFESANLNALQHLREVCLASSPEEHLISYQALNGALVNKLTMCLLGTTFDTSNFISVMGLLNERFNTLDLLFEEAQDCQVLSFNNLYSYQSWEEILALEKTSTTVPSLDQIFNPVFAPGAKNIMDNVGHCMGCKSLKPTNGVNSMDPNEKVGPGNNPYDNYLNGRLDLGYSIHFENIATATAPAAQVRITDTLDSEKFDLSSFEFGNFGFNNNVFSGIQENNGMLAVFDLRPERPCYLKMEASIDTTTGATEWLFSSLDTLTFQLTDDPDGGFLMPNIIHPEGEGFVNFFIDLKEGMSTGSQITNNAEIIFDYNEPIITNEWVNVFDDILPESQVNVLPDTIFHETFELKWDGIDQGSGLRYYDIFALTIEGSDTTLAIWQYHSGGTIADFTGEFGETYYFYSVATDSAGNTEPGVFEFDTEVLLYNPCWDTIVVNHEYEICEGDSALIQGTWQYEAGIYNTTLSSIYGCDSLIQSELIVYNNPEQPTITWNGTELISTPADSYQWYLDDLAIEDATTQEYVPIESGSYTVEVANLNGCKSLSEGYEVIISDLFENILSDAILVYPNPTSGVLNIDNLPIGKNHCELYNLIGEKQFGTILSNKHSTIDLSHIPKGIYFLKIKTNNLIIERKIIVD